MSTESVFSRIIMCFGYAYVVIIEETQSTNRLTQIHKHKCACVDGVYSNVSR